MTEIIQKADMDMNSFHMQHIQDYQKTHQHMTVQMLVTNSQLVVQQEMQN